MENKPFKLLNFSVHWLSVDVFFFSLLVGARLPIIEVLKRSVLAKGKEDWEVSSKKRGAFYMELCGP